MKKVYVLILALLVSIGLGLAPSKAQAQTIWDGTFDTSWYDASNTEFYIYTPEELAGLAQLVNAGNDFNGKTIYLEDDIWLNATGSTTNNWTMIGGDQMETTKEHYANFFRGTFHGNGHYIYNMYCSRDNGSGGFYYHAGLFGDLKTPCLIDSLVIVNPITRATGGFQGGLAACVAPGGNVTISKILVINANINQNHSGADGHNGSLIGGVYPNGSATTYITNCGATGTVYGAYSGGLTGGAAGGIFTNCYFNGSTSGGSWGCGGIASHDGTVNNCYSPSLGSGGTNGININNVSLTNPSATLGDAFRADCLLSINGGYPLLEFMICDDPTCGPVTNLTVSNIQGSSAQINWTASHIGTPVDYTIEYMENGTGDWMTVAGVTPPYLLEGLNPNTLYQIRVMSNCDDGSSSDYTLGSFSTTCMCGQVINLIAENVTGTSAQLSWAHENIGTIADYTIEYSETGMENWTTITGITDNTYILGGLEPSTAYDIRIIANCDNGFSSISPTVTTILTNCLVSGDIPIGNGTGTTYFYPVNNYYRYSYSQQIFTASEMGFNPQMLNGISFQYAHSTPSSSKTSVNIYLGHTTMSSFSGTSSFVPFDSLQLVYSGNLNCQQGWNEFSFSSPFFYNGTDNLVVVVDDNSYGYDGNSYTFNTHSTNGVNMCHALYSDSSNPDPTNPSSFSGSNNTYSDRSNVKFHFCNENSQCAAPSMMVTNVTSESAEIVWVAGYQETAWELEYKMSSESDWTPYGSVYSLDETISNLSPNTAYDVRLRSDCGGEYSNWVSANFTTECGPINTIPYYVDFESGVIQTSQDKYLNCWSRYTSNSSHYAYVGVGATNAHGGSNYLDFHYTPSCNVIAIMPAIDAAYPVSTLAADFWLKRTNNNSTMLEVGIMTDNDDYTTFEPIDTIDIPEIGVYREFLIPFTHYTGNGAFIAFRASNGNSAGFMMDDLTIDNAPACDAPNNIVVSNITNESVELTWTAGDQETSWELEYKTDSESSWTTYGSVYSTNEIVGNLLANTNYQIRLRSECGNGEYSNFVMTSFRTLCGPITQIPYVEDFNSYPTNSMPECWTLVSSNSNYHYVTSHNSSNCIISAGNTIYASPAIAENIEDLQVSFDFEREGSSSGTLDFGIMTDITNPNSFELIRHFDPAEGVVNHELIYLNNVVAAGPGRFLAFRQNSTATNWYYWVDNINVDYVPACVPPTMTLGTVGINEVTLNWNDDHGNQSDWELVYGVPGFDPDEATDVISVSGTPTFDLTGLNHNTNYQAYVRAYCGGEYSGWSSPVSFLTLAGMPAQTPYLCDFEDGNENSSWVLINGTQTNKWYIGVPTGATDSVLFVSDNGTSSTYNTGSTSNVWAYRDIQFGEGAEFNLSFLWKCYGESSYDYIQVFIGNPTGVSDGSNSTPAGAVQLTNPRLNLNNNWQRFSTMFGSEYANTTKRLYFLWHNDGSSGSNPPAIIDSIQITVSDCGRPNNLTNMGTTSSSVDIRFNAALSTDYAWEYVVCPANGNPDAATPVAIMDTFFTADNLNSNSTYNIYVRTACGDGGFSAWSNMLSVTTDCGPITQLPFTETFDTPNSDNYVTCWSRYASDPSHYVYMYGDVVPPTGQYSLDFHWTPNCSVIAIMPAVDDNINVSDLMASFWIQRTGSTSIFEIGVMTDKDDHTTFEPLDTIPSPTVDLWNYIDVPLSQYTGTGKYIAFRVTQGTSCGFRMDDITLDYIPSCWRPSNFTVSNVTATSVDLSWTPAGTETEWIVEYMSNSETDWNVMSSSTTSLTISGLDSNATYSFRVKANCGAGDESNYTETLTATTLPCSNACVYVLTMHDSFGDSWNGNTINIVVNGATVATATVSSGYDETVTYYQCDAAEVNFSWTTGSYASETSFTIADAEGNTLYTCSNGNNLTSGAVFFTHTCGTISCPMPSGLTVTNTTSSSVTLAWTENGNASEWNIVYGVPGFNPNTGGTIVTANTNPFTVDNLSADVYEFYVQANCDANDQSAWAGPVNATPGAINMPVSGSQTINACGGLIYDNGGLTNDYSSNCNGSLTINPDAPGMMVQVTGTYDTESSYDELTIYDGASTSGTSLGTYSGSGSINVTSTTGPLTLYFSSDGSVQHSGFQLTVNCVGGGTSDCNDPSNVQASNITTTGATITWTPGSTESAWNLQYKTASGSWSNSITVNNTPSYNLTGLTPATAYQVRVLALCDITTSSDWATASFTTQTAQEENCPAPTNVTATDIQNHSALISWTQEPNTANSWDIVYKPTSSSEWLTVTTTSNPYMISNLLGLTAYDVQVIAHCTNGQTSAGSEIAHFTTTNVGVNEYDIDGNISIFPNPTTGMVQVSSSKFQVSSVDVYDVYGKLLKTDAMIGNNTVDLSSYAAGVYFLRVSTENGVVTKRVVKK